MASRPLLSVCMIVKNEARNLGRALASVVPLRADLVVVDTGSTDATVEIARSFGARVESFAWVDDFSAARNYAFSHARGEWMLAIDADDEVSAELVRDVAKVLRGMPKHVGGIRVPVRNVDGAGQLLQRMSSTRIVRNGRGFGYQNRVHEDIEVPILGAGSTLAYAELPIVHHGYTAKESRAKGRSDRNLRLLRAAHEAEPDEPRHWHYLGLELAIVGRTAEAATWFERVVAERPTHVLAGWSASQLATIRMAERAFGAAWAAAVFGSRAELGRIPSLFALGKLALRERDAATAIASADALIAAPSSAEGDMADRIVRARILRAEAEALSHPKKAMAALADLVRKNPDHALAGDALVRIAEKAHPGDPSSVIAKALEAGPSASVIAGGVSAFVRARAFGTAVALAEKYGVRNESYAWALAHVGRAKDARDVIESFGESAGVHQLLLGLATTDAELVDIGLAACPPAFRDVVEKVLAGQTLAHGDEATIHGWAAVAFAFRAHALGVQLLDALPLAPKARRARTAVLLSEAGETKAAMTLALEVVSEPDAREVIGMAA